MGWKKTLFSLGVVVETVVAPADFGHFRFPHRYGRCAFCVRAFVYKEFAEKTGRQSAVADVDDFSFAALARLGQYGIVGKFRPYLEAFGRGGTDTGASAGSQEYGGFHIGKGLLQFIQKVEIDQLHLE